MNYDIEHKKLITSQAFKEYVLGHYKDHTIYFITVTFENSFIRSKALSADEVLNGLKQKLDQASTRAYSTRPNKNRMLCVREKSHASKRSTMRKEDHYHCFYMIPKSRKAHFERLAVTHTEKLYYQPLDKDFLKLHLDPRILEKSRARKWKHTETEERLNPQISLKLHTIDVRLPETLDDLARAYDYATKHVSNMPSDIKFTLAELKEFQAACSKNRSHKQAHDDKDHFFLF